MNLYEIWEMAQRIELGLDPLGTDGLTREIISEKMPFSSLKENISKLSIPVIGEEREKFALPVKME